MKALLLFLALALAASGPAVALHGPADKPRVHTVTVDASRFSPAALTVAPGDAVVFRNADMFPHTATSRVGAFDSKEIQPGKSWKFVVPKRGRLFEYSCTLHPTMKGALRVR